MSVNEPDDFGLSTRGFPRAGNAAQIWEFLLRYAIRAPSGHNTQPWRFRITDGRLHLYSDRSRALPVVDPNDRALVISCGAVLAHLTVALRHFGYVGEVTPFPDPLDHDLLATLSLGHQHTPLPDDHALFEAIDNRHTHRAPFQTKAIPEPVLAQLQRAALKTGATLHVLTDEETRTAVAALVGEGDRVQFGNAQFRRELAAWVRPNRTHRTDGMPGYAFGISDLPSLLGPAMIAAVNTGTSQARKDERLALAAPALLVLSTLEDTPAGWLAAGQAVALVLLRATVNGLAASFLNQPIEVPALRVRVRELVDPGRHPQLLLRSGYPPNDRPLNRATPRRTVADVLTHDSTTGTAP